MDWGNEHLMSMFIVYKGKCIKKFVEYILNFNHLTLFNKLICKQDTYDYYKFFLLKNNKNSHFLKNESNLYDISSERWYYLYIIYVYEMGISNYFKNINYKYSPFYDSEQLKNDYNFEGIPLINSHKSILEKSPICKLRYLKKNLRQECINKNKIMFNLYNSI